MWTNLKLAFYLLFLTVDTLLINVLRFVAFMFVWLLLLCSSPFMDQATVRKNLIECINRLDK